MPTSIFKAVASSLSRTKKVFAVATLALLAAATPAAAAPCTTTAKAPWSWGAGGPRASAQLMITATTEGSDCHSAKATIVIHAMDGHPLYTATRPTAQVLTLSDATTPAEMTKALQSWVDSTTCPVAATDLLPIWKRGKPTLDATGNTPFSTSLTRTSYQQRRTAAEPLLCFIQGSESVTALSVSQDGQSAKPIGSFELPH
jgi:hypothetical protein